MATHARETLHDYLRYCESLGIAALPRRANAIEAGIRGTLATDDRRPATEFSATSNGVPSDASTALLQIRTDLGDCRRCPLCAGRTNIVFGVGDPQARLMFVGEGPGADEDAQGEPFVGRAGQLLNKIIAAMGLQRQQVYIGNIVKCRPPENRAPTPEEAATCKPFLLQQIAAIRPQVIVCLGSTAVRYLFEDETIKITKARGLFRDWSGIAVMPTYHPAFLLRNPAMKKPVWEDMLQVMAKLGLERPVS